MSGEIPPSSPPEALSAGSPVGRARRTVAHWFLRVLAGIYLIAFLSLWIQIEGLIGQNGILPVQLFLDGVRSQAGPERYWYVPTLSWLDTGDGWLHAQCLAGVVLSLLVLAGRAQAPALLLLWALYLSLTTASQKFLSYQWDNLLLETGLLAVLLPRWRWWRARPGDGPVLPALLLLRLLLFKLMFCSGAVKLSSGDETWRNLTALVHHYETQPLTTWTAWYIHQVPVAVHQINCAFMFFVELVVPFAIFGPRRARLAAFWLLVGLQVVIILTGNYTFFNWLAIALCIPLLDDDALPARLRRPFGEAIACHPWRRRLRGALSAPVAAVFVLLSCVEIAGAFRQPIPWPRAVGMLYRWVSPLRSVNGYGLFAVMTTTRPEIIIEGSNDGVIWEAYEFPWKAGDPGRRPRFVAPHQPRLDWQMWFAALGSYEGNPWFTNLLVRLMQGSPEVLRLLARNPFPEQPPRYIRAVLYDYRFTDIPTRRATGAWWQREPQRPYGPILARRDAGETVR